MTRPISSMGAGASTGSGGGGGSPLSINSFNTGNGTVIVPAASHLIVEIYSKGGDGGLGASHTIGGGGQSGGYSKKEFDVVAGDVGKTLTWNTNDGAKALVLGDAAATNLTAAALNMQVTNGANGGSSAGGSGAGVATGGTTNINGNPGQSQSAGSRGGNAPGPSGGAGGAPETNGVSPGGGGGGGQLINAGGGEFDDTHGAGGGPKIVFTWT